MKKSERARQITITLVEDNAAEAGLFCSMTGEISPDVKVHAFTSAEEALPFLASNETDLVVVDLNLAAMTGHQLLSRVRGIAHHRRTPVVVMSASQDPADRESVLSYGAAKYVLKSLDLAETEQQFRDLIAFANEHHRTNASRT